MTQENLFTKPVEGDPDGTVFFGSCSFSEKSWVGPFYPPGTPASGFLPFYATRFKAVEIDATYYAVPPRETVRSWYERTPPDFTFTAKFPRAIVHAGEGPRPDPARILLPDATYGVRDTFLASMHGLGEKLGALLLQFPYFSRAVFPTPQAFYDRLDRFLADLPPGFRYAVEVRNRNYVTAEYAALLKAHSAAMTLIDFPWMPTGREVAETLDPLTTDWLYVRLMGDRKKIESITSSWDREVVDVREQLADWARLLAGLKGRALKIYVFVNNHYAGHSPATLRRLRELYRAETG